jgi:hypothetical protein
VSQLSEEWIQTCERIIEQIQKISNKKDKDRLDLIQSMRFSLYALHRSILGWLTWVNNPDIMVSFKLEDLEDMNKKLTKYIKEFLKYDIEVTDKATDKSIAVKKSKQKVEEKARPSPDDIFYI